MQAGNRATCEKCRSHFLSVTLSHFLTVPSAPFPFFAPSPPPLFPSFSAAAAVAGGLRSPPSASPPGRALAPARAVDKIGKRVPGLIAADHWFVSFVSVFLTIDFS